VDTVTSPGARRQLVVGAPAIEPNIVLWDPMRERVADVTVCHETSCGVTSAEGRVTLAEAASNEPFTVELDPAQRSTVLLSTWLPTAFRTVVDADTIEAWTALSGWDRHGSSRGSLRPRP
jgi:hypothetical protein